jgi:signal transduction histidine kinase
MSITLGEGVVGHIAQSRVAEIVNDMQHDPRALHVPGTPDQPEMLMCAPLISKDELVGVMVAVRLGDRPLFTQNDLGFLIGLAGQAVIAIQNARLYISEQTRAAELARALERQHELDRLKTEFIQNISHELRTPLAIVRGYAEMLDTGAFGELSSDQREPISVMARRSRMLSKMLDDLVAILSLEPRHMANEAIDLPDLVQNMLADFQSAAKQAGLRLMSEVAAGSLVIKGDAIQMRRVFDNLLSNACKFTQAGGSVTVRLSRDGGQAVFEVADTGIGIPADKLDRIFERFYQVDGSATRRYGGVGLGLALVKEIVEAHRGQVTAQSQLGEGTTFRITLPVMPENS